MKLINYLKCAYTVIRPAGFSYCIALLIGALASYIGANSQSRITAMIQSVDSSAHILPLLGYSVIGGLCIASRGAIFTYLNKYMYSVLTTALFNRIQSASMQTWDTEWNTSEITKLIMTDADEVINTVSLFCNVSVRTITTLITISPIWYSLSHQTYLIGVLLCIIQIAIMHFIHPWHQQKSDKSVAIKQKIETNINEYIQHHLHIIMYSWQNLYQERNVEIQTEYRNVFKYESLSYGLFLVGLQVIPSLGDIIIIYALLQNNVGIIHFIELYSYYQSMISAVNVCKDQWIQTWMKRIAIERTWNILQKPIYNEVSQIRLRRLVPSITFDNITFQYPTGIRPVFSGFSLHISVGEHVHFKAPSGKGKTTLLKLLLGLYPVEKGSICIGNKDISSITPMEIRSMISIIPQESFYDGSRTIRENIMTGYTKSFDIAYLLDKVKLTELQNELDTKPVTLSGGQKQRIAIARIFLQNTPIIILDEPTSALDKETERSIIDIVCEYAKDRTVIWITHNDILHANIKRIYL